MENNNDLPGPIVQQVQPFKDKINRIKIHPHLPCSNFVLGLFSPRQTGKSTICSWLLLHPDALGQDYYKSVYIFSPTIEQDDTSRFLLERFNCDTQYTDKKLQNIIDKQKEFKKDEMKDICILFDDCIGEEAMKRNSLLTSFICTARHARCDIIISLQSFKNLPKVSRINLTDVAIGCPISSQAMKKDLAEEFGDNFEDGESEFWNLYNEATKKERYNFMVMKLKENPIQVFSNFEKRIY